MHTLLRSRMGAHSLPGLGHPQAPLFVSSNCACTEISMLLGKNATGVFLRPAPQGVLDKYARPVYLLAQNDIADIRWMHVSQGHVAQHYAVLHVLHV